MILPSIGKILVDALKNDGLKIQNLNQVQFRKELSELSKIYTRINGTDFDSYNALYIQNKDLILFNDNTTARKDYILLHEVIHAIRAQNTRLPRMKMEVRVHVTMKKLIDKVAKSIKNKSIHRAIFLNVAKSDIEYWREESIADCLSIFMCTEYGIKTRRSAIDTKRLTFLPLGFKDSYNATDKKRFVSNVRKECLITLKFIMDNYIYELFDKKLVIKNFKKFFEEELVYCQKKIKKQIQIMEKNIINPIDVVPIENFIGNIGKKTQKTSHRPELEPKPFKSGSKINTIKGVIEHPILKIPAYTFEEDSSYVECRRCKIIE